MTYLTKNGMFAVAVAGLVAAGILTVLQGGSGVQTTRLDTPVNISASTNAKLTAPKANGAVAAVDPSLAVALSTGARTARAGEPAADLVLPAEPAVALARGRGTGL